MIVQEILTAQFDPRKALDAILVELCEMIIHGQMQDSEYFGMVAACVLCPDGTRVYGINHAGPDGKRVHAERAALNQVENPGPDCMVITTLSPCNQPMDERYGESCTDLLESLGISHVYAGYRDPSQATDLSVPTENPRLLKLCKRFADTFLDEDYDPNGPPPGPEFKPTMPAGTVRVDVSDVYDWYKLGQHISNLKGLGKHDFGAGPPSTIFSFGSEELEHKFINALKKTGLTTTDIDPVDPKQPRGMPRQKTDPTFNVDEATGTYPKVLYHGSTQEIKGPLTPRQAHDIGGAPGSNKNAIYATDDPNFAIAYSLSERGSDTGTFGWKKEPRLIFFGGKIRHGQNVYLHVLPTRDEQGRPLFTKGDADAEWYSVPGVTAITPIKVITEPVDQYLHLLRKPTPEEQKIFQANKAKQPAGMPRQKTDPTYNVAETLEETPPEVLRALDQAAQKNGYKNWADVKANPRSETAVITVAKLANTIMRTTPAHHQPEKIFYKGKFDENFADGRVKGKSRPGRVKRAGASCKGSVTDLRARAKKASGERAKMYHWCANMKSGRKK